MVYGMEIIMKNSIIRFRTFLLKHFKNPKLRTLIYGLISYEMISYVSFGMGTALVDLTIFHSLNLSGFDAILANIISTACAIVFSYITNKLWVFKSKTHGFYDILNEFIRFAYARAATLFMSTAILYISKLRFGNDKKANLIAKIIAMVLTVVTNYIISKLFIFKNRKGTTNENQK